MVAILGGVFSHKQGFTTIAEVLPGLGFHAVAMGLGMHCLARAARKATVAAE